MVPVLFAALGQPFAVGALEEPRRLVRLSVASHGGLSDPCRIKPIPPTSKGDDMHLHPHIHSELIRQQQHELARRALHAPLTHELAPRSRLGNGAAVKIATLVVAALATLALTIPSAYAASGKKRPHGKPGAIAASVNQGKGNGKGNGGGRVVAPVIYYVYWTVPAVQPASASNPDDDCVNYQLNCTREQNCQFWGFDCEPATIAIDTQAASQDSSTSDSSTNSEAALADSAATDATASSDSAATQSTSDAAASVSDSSQNDDQDC